MDDFDEPCDEGERDSDYYDSLAEAHESIVSKSGSTASMPLQQTQRDSRVIKIMPSLEKLERFRLSQVAPPASPATQPMDPGSFGHFRIEKMIGEGSYGVVYLATNEGLGRSLALKIARPEVSMSPSMRKRFENEAGMAAMLEHPGIVPVYESGTIAGVQYIASALCDGVTLEQWLFENKQPVSARTAAGLIEQIAIAMAHAHGRGVLHRDLKPSNIMLVGENAQPTNPEKSDLSSLTPKVTDFGLGRMETEPGMTRTGAILGTPSYMAPEQASGDGPNVCTGSDVYAMGVILYELLTGSLPFKGANTLQTLEAVCMSEPTPPLRLRADVPRDLNSICLRCLAKDPAKRYSSANELADDLRAFLEHRPVRARPATIAEQLASRFKRSPLVSSLLLGLGAFITATAIGASIAASRLASQRDEIRNHLNRAVDAERELQQTVRLLENQLFAQEKQPVIEALTKTIEQQPNSAHAVYRRGTHFWRIEKYDLAVADFERALEINPNHPDALADKARILMLGGENYRDDEIALQLVDRIRDEFGTNWSTDTTKALALVRHSRSKEALPLMERAVRRRHAQGTQANSLHLFLMSMIQYQLGKHDAAAESFEQALNRLDETRYELPDAEIARIQAEAETMMGK